MDEKSRRLWAAYDAAIKKIASGKVGASGGFESEYAKAYQKLVAAGLAMQIKKKYRD
jgi:hypothetical protein